MTGAESLKERGTYLKVDDSGLHPSRIVVELEQLRIRSYRLTDLQQKEACHHRNLEGVL